MFPKSTPDTFSRKLYRTFKTHRRFLQPKLARSDFIIAHYAGEVHYQSHQFLDKKKDYIVPEHQDLLSTSKCAFVAGLFPPPREDATKSSKFSSIGSRFKAWSIYTKGRPEELIDEIFAESCHLLEVLRAINVGLLCVQENAGDRPDMTSVVQMLDDEDVLLPEPKQPAYFIGRDVLKDGFSSSDTRVISINGLTITELDGR